VNLILQQHRNICKVLKLDLAREDNFPTLTCVCSADASLTIRECHQIASQLEDQIENALHHRHSETGQIKQHFISTQRSFPPHHETKQVRR
jgi:hypothetical protein